MKITKEQWKNMKNWADTEEADLFKDIIKELYQDALLGATMSFDSRVAVDYTKECRSENASRSKAYEEVIEILGEIKLGKLK